MPISAEPSLKYGPLVVWSLTRIDFVRTLLGG